MLKFCNSLTVKTITIIRVEICDFNKLKFRIAGYVTEVMHHFVAIKTVLHGSVFQT